jgi:hypothetical protein
VDGEQVQPCGLQRIVPGSAILGCGRFSWLDTLPAGRAAILFVAAFFYAYAIRSILVFVGSLAGPYIRPEILTLFWGLLTGGAASYLLKGSILAKRFLVAMSVILLLIDILKLWLEGGSSNGFVDVAFGVSAAYSLYLLTWSPVLRSEFERRHAGYEAEKEAARQRFYAEFEAENDKAGD